jgi:putative Mg2+ transporter-C (MgtC) family protein
MGGIITGIGFLGTGTILFRNSALEGLTTAAGLWVTAAVGITVGFGFYALAIFATLLTLFVFRSVWFLENRVRANGMRDEEQEHSSLRD